VVKIRMRRKLATNIDVVETMFLALAFNSALAGIILLELGNWIMGIGEFIVALLFHNVKIEEE